MREVYSGNRDIINRNNMYSKIAILSLLLTFTLDAFGGNFYVSKTGSNKNNGSKEQPFKTIKKALSIMSSGDTCYLREGTYKDLIRINNLKGERSKKITISAYKDEKVLFSGADELKLNWKRWKGDIYKAKLNKEVWQLYIKDQLVQVARWPNANLEDGSIWEMEKSMRYTDRKIKRGKVVSGKTKLGVICDRNPKTQKTKDDGEGASDTKITHGVNNVTLAETGIDFTGSVAVLNTGHWLTWARRVENHKEGQDWFEYDGTKMKINKYVVYYLLGLPCLDKENEWWYDKENREIYLYAPNGVNPKSIEINGKVRDYSLLVNNSSHITIKGIDFIGSTFKVHESNNILIEDCNFKYPSTNKFMLGEYAWFKPRPSKKDRNAMTYIFNKYEGMHYNVVRNCKFSYCNSPAIAISSQGSVLENCLIHDIGWDVNTSGAGGSIYTGANVTVRRNTIYNCGNSEGIRPGIGSTIELNRMWNMSNSQHDGSAINIGTNAQDNVNVCYNWVYNVNRQGLRFDSTKKGFGKNGSIHHNVSYSNDGNHFVNKIKGDYQIIYNNTCVNSYLSVPKGYGKTAAHNENSLVCNNLSDDIVEWNKRTRYDGITAEMKNNISGAERVKSNLNNPNIFDFRPAKNSEIIDAGFKISRKELRGKKNISGLVYKGKTFDIGAYEYGAKEYWIPGFQAKKATFPIPANGIKINKLDDLMFLQAYKANKHFVYWGVNKEEIKIADKSSTTYKGELKGKNNIIDFDKNISNKTIYWRVDALVNGKIVKGDVWSFKL